MYKERKCLLFCIFIECIQTTVKGRDLREEYKTLVERKINSNFDTFCQQLCQAISAVLIENLDLIEQITNTMEQNPNINTLKNFTNQALLYMV
jgi:hypothetical protein